MPPRTLVGTPVEKHDEIRSLHVETDTAQAKNRGNKIKDAVELIFTV